MLTWTVRAKSISGEVAAATQTHTGSLKVKTAPLRNKQTSLLRSPPSWGLPRRESPASTTRLRRHGLYPVTGRRLRGEDPHGSEAEHGVIGLLRLLPKNGKPSTGLRFRFSVARLQSAEDGRDSDRATHQETRTVAPKPDARRKTEQPKRRRRRPRPRPRR